jgi:hypothetical protein
MNSHPWDQVSGESGPAYVAFGVFRDLGPERSLRKAYSVLSPQRALRAQRATKELKDNTRSGRISVPSQWKNWSRDHKWQERAKAFDKHLAAVEQQQREEEARRAAIDWQKRREEQDEQLWTIQSSLLRGAVAACESGKLIRAVQSTTEQVPGSGHGTNAGGHKVKTSSINHDAERQIRLTLDIREQLFGQAKVDGSDAADNAAGAVAGQIPVVESFVTWAAEQAAEIEAEKQNLGNENSLAR